MSAIEQSLYVAVGAVDLAAEKVRTLPVVKTVRDRTAKFRETSVIDQAREIEPKVRKQAKELSKRGQTVVKRTRSQIEDIPENARKQATEVRGRIEKVLSRENGKTQPASKTKASSGSSSSSSSSKAS